MNTEKEIKELKERVVYLENTVQEIIDWSQRVFGPPQDNTGGQGEETTSDDLYEVVSFDVRKRPADMTGDFWMSQPYAWKLKVKNTSPKKISLQGSIVFQDSDGFEISNIPMGMFEIKANSTQSETGIAEILDKQKVGKIKEITCQFQVF